MSFSNADPRIAVSTDKVEGVDEPGQPIRPFSFGSVFRPATFDIEDTPRPSVSPRVPAEPHVERELTKTYPVTVGVEVAGDNGNWNARIIDTNWRVGMPPNEAVVAATMRTRAATSIPLPDRNVIFFKEGNSVPPEWTAFANATAQIALPDLETETVRAALADFANS